MAVPLAQATGTVPPAMLPERPLAETPAAGPVRPGVAAGDAFSAALPASPPEEVPVARQARPAAVEAAVRRGLPPLVPSYGSTPPPMSDAEWGPRSIGACEPTDVLAVVNGYHCITPAQLTTYGSAGSRRT